MKKSLENRIRAKLVKIGKKNAFLRIMVIPVMVSVMFVSHLIDYCFSNGKRFAALAMTFFLFAAYSSFSFPIFMPEKDTVRETGNEFDEVSLAGEAGIELKDLELLDDEDVLDGYEDTHLAELDEVDKYALDEILESDAASADGKERREERSRLAGSVTASEFSRDDWRLVLINKQNPIPEDYTFELGTIKGNMQCDKRILDDLMDMLRDAKEDGVNLMICSPYRDMERQEMLFNRKIDRYMARNMSYLEAYQLAGQAVTVPGASEHQIGLALDIVCETYMTLDEKFGETQAGKWLAANSADYGFILRYPKDKEYITGIEYEPWHFRYVGPEAARLITDKGITLEEFWEDL